MVNIVGKRVADYLKRNQSDLLDNWMSKVIVDPNDPNKNFVKINGLFMLNLVISCAGGTNIDEDKLRNLAHKVSLERLKSNANIGDFVYNVTIGRSEIFDHMPNIGISIDELYPVFKDFNLLFDKFLYFAIRHYTELKNQQLTEQSSFIEQTHKDRLTILGQMSSSFVHEFRNPLTFVIGFVQLLQTKYPSLEYIDILTKELDQLKFRITQFLLLSKKGIDSKEKENFQIANVFDETLDFLYPMIVSSNVIIERDIDNSIYLLGYRDKFRQALINILMNSLDAISLCLEKIIHIKVHIADNSLLVVSISNNGPSISKEMIMTIFEPFVSSKKLGTGIGLYICRNIIADHNGIIECESDDKLTTFRIVIPVKE